MKLLAKVNAILKQQPLPDDAPEQMDALLEQAEGEERQLIERSYEALHAAASVDQFFAWFL